jgi:hypothetical protein
MEMMWGPSMTLCSLEPFVDVLVDPAETDCESSHVHLPAHASGVHPAHAKFRMHSPRSPYVRRMISKSKQLALRTVGSPRLRDRSSGPREQRRKSEPSDDQMTPRTRGWLHAYSLESGGFWQFF